MVIQACYANQRGTESFDRRGKDERKEKELQRARGSREPGPTIRHRAGSKDRSEKNKNGGSGYEKQKIREPPYYLVPPRREIFAKTRYAMIGKQRARGFGNKGLIDGLVKSRRGQWGEGMTCPGVKTRESGYGIGLCAFVGGDALIVAIRQVQVTMAVWKCALS